MSPASDDERGGNAGLNYYPIDTRLLHLAGWFNRVIFSLTVMWGGVQLIISIGSIRLSEHDQTADKKADCRMNQGRTKAKAARGICATRGQF
ncbi:MAG: hypothetical protein LAO55_08195 [Acidobacteriia bacterium]|nr:hypothetical protein [Terriglobia bacterium]